MNKHRQQTGSRRDTGREGGATTGRGSPPRSRIVGVATRAGLGLVVILLGLWTLPGVRALIGNNLHPVISDQILRSGQLSASELEEVIERHAIRSIVNLRGSHAGEAWYDSERAVAAQLGVIHHDLGLSADRQPDRRDVLALIDLLETSPRPVLVHCEAGADRAGLASAIARIVVGQADLAESRHELSLAFGHIPFGPSSALDHVLDEYERYLDETGQPHGADTFKRWAATEYVPYGFKGAIEALQFPTRSNADVGFEARFEVRNLSPETWLPWSSDEPGVRLGFHFRRDGETQWHEYLHRFDLSGPVAPGQSATLTGFIATPGEPGFYTVKIDLVSEGVTWFELQGSTPLVVRLTVEPRS